MKKTKILTVLGVLLAMGITACGGGAKESEKPADTSSAAPASSESSKQSSQSSQGSQGSQSSQSSQSSQGSSSSSASHTHEFGDWAPEATPAATCTDPGKESRTCSCGEKEYRDTPKLDHVLSEDGAVVKVNSDGKKITQKTCTQGNEHVLVMPVLSNSGVFKTTPGATAETWTIGDEVAASSQSADYKNGIYKLSNSSSSSESLLFKVNVATAVEGAEIEIGAKYVNNNPRHFYSERDGGSDGADPRNGDDPSKDAYRYYTKVNDGEFVPIAYTGLMSSVFGDGQSIKYMPLGKFNLKAGENLIYVRQGALGYRVTIQGEFRVAIGQANIGGEDPSHEHVLSDTYEKDATNHWKVCTAANCDEPAGTQFEKAAHDKLGTPSEEDVPATCEATGKHYWKCSVCGYESYDVINALGHDYEGQTPNITKAATCDEDGSKTTHCNRCGQDIVEVIPALGHTWVAGTPVESVGTKGQADYRVGYTVANCDVDNAVKFEMKALDGDLHGSNKGGTPSGYLKLNSANDYMEWKFDVTLPAGKAGYIGTIYQRGSMDSFTSNTQKTYAWISSSSNATDYVEGNFRLEVNGEKVDKSAMMDVTFEQMTLGGADSSALGNNYSPIADCKIGQVLIQGGTNTIRYTRLGSYNLVISDIVLVLKSFEHEHHAADAWSSNETQHWHACDAIGCPVEGGYKMDLGDHDKLGTPSEEDVPATCEATGKHYWKCSVCGYESYDVIAKLDHNFGAWTQSSAATCEAAGEETRTCADCGEVETRRIAKLDHVYGDAVNSYAAGTDDQGNAYAATKSYNCSLCNKSALRWQALDFDTTLSDSGLEKNSDNVRFKSGSVENKNKTEVTGSHIVYKINVKEAVANAGLAFKIKNTGGNNGNAAVFGPITNDSSVGSVKQPDGSFVDATHRYGLKVNGVEYFLGEDDYGNQSSVTGWFDWPVNFPLEAGVNTIDVFAYRGYRANMYEFQLTGLPLEVNNHTHNNADTWQYNLDQHYHVCTVEGCPEEGGIYGAAEHEFGTPVVTQNTDGKDVNTATCACGATQRGILVSDGTVVEGTIADGDVAGKMSNGTVVTWKMPVTKAGEVTIQISMMMSSGSHGSQSFDPSKYVVKVGGAAQTSLLPTGKTYSQVGLTTSVKYFSLAKYTVTAEDVENGEILIEFDHNNSNYRLLFTGEVRIVF